MKTNEVKPIPIVTDGWNEWGRHVLKELERLNDCYEEMAKEMVNMTIEMATLKAKTSVWWGIIGGCIPGLGAILLLIFQHIFK